MVTKNHEFNQKSLTESFLPEDILSLRGELKKVDEILSDERFIEPFLKRFSSKIGRPSIPVEVYIRMMYLKKRYNLGYESLCKEVSDSISWRIFCRIGLEGKVPDFTTLSKLTKKYGEEVIEELNSLLVKKAMEEKVIRTKKVRVDTTVVSANIHHPTDASLLCDGVRVINRVVKRIKKVFSVVKIKWRDRSRSIKRRIISIVKFGVSKGKRGKEFVKDKVAEVVEITREVVESARKVLKEVKGGLRKGLGKSFSRIVEKLEEVVEVVKKVIKQTEEVLSGRSSIPDRIVSIFDITARPIKMKNGRGEVYFGRKVALCESEEGVIVKFKVFEGNPSDKSLAISMIEGVKEVLGEAPKEAVADRGFYSEKNEEGIKEIGVKRVAIPKPGKKGKERREHEGQEWFKRLVRWRSGGEARIGLLKRRYGMGRSLFKGNTGTAIWVGLSVFAQNIDRLVWRMG